MLKYIPKYITNKAIVLYIMLLVLIPIIWGYPMQWYFLLLGIIQVFGFFYFSNKFSIETRKLSSLEYEKKIFRLSLVIRIIYVVIIYYFYLSHSPVNLPMEFHMADSGHYHDLAYAFAKELRNGNKYIKYNRKMLSRYIILRLRVSNISWCDLLFNG